MIGDYYRNMRQAPGTHAPVNDGVCKRGCCWTPFGCGRQKTCDCHEIKPYVPDIVTLILKHERKKRNG